MTGMRLVHYCNNKRNNSQKHPEKNGYLRTSYLDLPNAKGQCQTIMLRKILQRRMDFLKDAMLKGNQKSPSQRGNDVFSNMNPIPSTEIFFLINLFNK